MRNFSALSSWHTWTRTATCHRAHPAGASRSDELFYWMREAEWQVMVSGEEAAAIGFREREDEDGRDASIMLVGIPDEGNKVTVGKKDNWLSHNKY